MVLKPGDTIELTDLEVERPDQNAVIRYQITARQIVVTTSGRERMVRALDSQDLEITVPRNGHYVEQQYRVRVSEPSGKPDRQPSGGALLFRCGKHQGRDYQFCILSGFKSGSSIHSKLGSPPKAAASSTLVNSRKHFVVALLAFPDWEAVARWAALLPIDLRDLNEAEVAYIERVTPKTVREWRTQGTGPAYRNEAGIRYPVRELWIWRQKGRQTITAQRVRRGRRR